MPKMVRKCAPDVLQHGSAIDFIDFSTMLGLLCKKKFFFGAVRSSVFQFVRYLFSDVFFSIFDTLICFLPMTPRFVFAASSSEYCARVLSHVRSVTQCIVCNMNVLSVKEV